MSIDGFVEYGEASVCSSVVGVTGLAFLTRSRLLWMYSR